jgi:hypothetical protein
VADYSWRYVTTTRVEYFLPNPTSASEFGKAYSAVARHVESCGLTMADDTVTVSGSEEEIVLWFLKPGDKEAAS